MSAFTLFRQLERLESNFRNEYDGANRHNYHLKKDTNNIFFYWVSGKTIAQSENTSPSKMPVENW